MVKYRLGMHSAFAIPVMYLRTFTACTRVLVFVRNANQFQLHLVSSSKLSMKLSAPIP